MTARNATLSPALPNPHALRNLLIAAVVAVALYFVPYLGFVTYPLRLLVTFIHEGSHALMTVLTGGQVVSLVIRPNGSGVTLSRGGFMLLIAPVGYLGATLYGALLLAALRRGISGKHLLLFTGGIIGLLTICFVRPWPLNELVNFPLSLGGGIVLCSALIFAGLRLKEQTAALVAAFMGVQCILNALFDLHTLFQLSILTGDPTDAQNMAQMTLIPAVVWSVLWLAIAAVLLWRVVLIPMFKNAHAEVNR